MSTIDNISARPTKMCPVCRAVHTKNFDRHLNQHFDQSTSQGRREKTQVKREAVRRTVQGLRACNLQLLPTVITEALHKDVQARNAFNRFLDDVGVTCPKEPAPKQDPEITEEPPRGTPSKRKAEDCETEDLEVCYSNIIRRPVLLFDFFKKLFFGSVVLRTIMHPPLQRVPGGN